MKSDTLYQISRIPLKIQFSPSSRVWTSAFAQRNPPRSLWLQFVHRTDCLTRRAHTAVPPLHFVFGAKPNKKCDIEMKNKEEFLETDRSVLVVRDYLAKGL